MKMDALALERALHQPVMTSSRNITKLRGEQQSSPISEAARERLLSMPREPFLKVRWNPVLFFHFRIDPEILAPAVPAMFELELQESAACLSLAVVHMSGFRSSRVCSRGLIVQAFGQRQFLNLRTYVGYRGERGVLFLHGWLSRPPLLLLPSSMLGLPYRFASFQAVRENTTIVGHVKAGAVRGSLAYRICLPEAQPATVSPRGSAAEFAMEQYSGFFARRDRGYVFHVWHPPWLQTPVEAQFNDTSLLTNAFPWFAQATFASAHLTDPIDDVWLSRAYRLPSAPPGQGNHRVLSAFYEMP